LAIVLVFSAGGEFRTTSQADYGLKYIN